MRTASLRALAGTFLQAELVIFSPRATMLINLNLNMKNLFTFTKLHDRRSTSLDKRLLLCKQVYGEMESVVEKESLRTVDRQKA